MAFYPWDIGMDLDTTGRAVMVLSAFLVFLCMALVFILEQSVPVAWLVLGHALAMVSAVGVKLGYILRLEAQARAK